MPLDPSIILRQQPVADPVQNYAKILQLKNLQAQAQSIPLQIQGQQLDLQSKQIQNQQAQQTFQQQQAVVQALQNHKGDFDAAIADLTQQGNPGALTLQENRTKAQKAVADLQKTNGDIAKQAQDAQTAKAGHLADIADSVINADPAIRPYVYLNQKAFAEKVGYAQPGQLPDTYSDAILPTLKGIVAQGRTAKDQSEIVKNTAQGAAATANANKTTTLLPGEIQNQGLQTTELQQKTTGTVPTTQYQNAELGVRKQEIGIQAARLAIDKQAADAGANLTPEAKEQAAQLYEKTGTLPSLGMGKAGIGTRVAIMNRGAEVAPGADIGSNKASYGADKSSLTTLQKQRDAVGAFENTASKNLDLFISSASKIVDSGSPILNLPLRMISDKLAGSANMAAVNAARQVANNEIAKVTTNPTLSGTLSDSARHEVEAYNPQTATFKQTLAVANILRTDMTNRRVSLDNGIKEIKGRLGGGNTPAVAGEQKATHRFNPATGKIEAIQ